MAKRSDSQEAVRLKNRPRRESGETQVERIHPGEQGRSNPYNQFSTTCQNSARMDKRTGWKCYLSSSSSSSWKHSDNWWTRTCGTAEATFSFFCYRFRLQSITIHCNRRTHLAWLKVSKACLHKISLSSSCHPCLMSVLCPFLIFFHLLY